ncbi:hypothetical protein MAHJHV57_45260 [Mycobacterium avium subsp. hominissuis]
MGVTPELLRLAAATPVAHGFSPSLHGKGDNASGNLTLVHLGDPSAQLMPPRSHRATVRTAEGESGAVSQPISPDKENVRDGPGCPIEIGDYDEFRNSYSQHG